MDNGRKELKVVTIFLASPGDAADERERVRRGVDRVNRLVAKPNGCLYEVIGWEDIPAGTAQRAQEIINPFVNDSDIFIGVLKKRFGTPTGKAESGTQEEYELACSRIKDETTTPEVKIYFKRLSEDEVSDPGPQLQKVLEFKNRVAGTSLFHEFEDSDDLRERIENELANLIYCRYSQGAARLNRSLRAISPLGARMLSLLLDGSEIEIGSLKSAIGEHEAEAESVLDTLQSRGLLRIMNDRVALPDATEPFLAICKQLFGIGIGVQLLKSVYFHKMTNLKLEEIIGARYHCRLSMEQTHLLARLASFSPAAAQYVLFGDTTLYDNLAKHGEEINEQKYSQEMLFRNLLQNVTYQYIGDVLRSKILGKVGEITIQAQVIRMGINAGNDKGIEYAVDSVLPIVRVRAAQDLRMGQMVTAQDNLIVQIGTLMMKMGEWQLAIGNFDKVLARPDVSKVAMMAALNNKGLALEHIGQVDDAIALYEKASALNPEADEPRKNLERLRKGNPNPAK